MMKQLESKVTELGILDSSKITVDISGIAPLKGIKVEQGFVCKVREADKLCMKGTTSWSDMDHHLLTHPKLLRPSGDKRYNAATIQRLYMGSTQCVVVNTALFTPVKKFSSYQVITQTILPSLPPPQPPCHENDKDRPPILRFTNFDDLLADTLQQSGGAEDLVILGSLPGEYCEEKDLEPLTDIGIKWMEECRVQHKNLDKLIQRMLGGNYPKYVIL